MLRRPGWTDQELSPDDAGIGINAPLSLAAGLQFELQTLSSVSERDMIGSGDSERFAPGAAMLLLQAAAAQAEIGPFARRACETPQEAARCYRAAMAAYASKGRRPAA